MTLHESKRQLATQLESGIYVYKNPIPNKERIHVMIWKPKAKNPCYNYLVKPDFADKEINRINLSMIAHKENVIALREKAKPTKEKMDTIVLGQIYSSSWGWEQTNVDFYQVTSKKGSMVGLRSIGSKMIEQDSWASGKVMPAKDSFKGEEFYKRPNFSYEKPYFTLSSFSSANLWDGKPERCSWWG